MFYDKSCVIFAVAVLRGYAQEVGSRDGRGLRDTPSSFSGHMGAGKVTVSVFTYC